MHGDGLTKDYTAIVTFILMVNISLADIKMCVYPFYAFIQCRAIEWNSEAVLGALHFTSKSVRHFTKHRHSTCGIMDRKVNKAVKFGVVPD